MAALQKAGIDPIVLGDHARLTVTVQSPTVRHEVSAARVSAWLKSSGRSPREQTLKGRLRMILNQPKTLDHPNGSRGKAAPTCY